MTTCRSPSTTPSAGWSPSAGTWNVEGADSDIYSGQYTAEALSLWSQTMTWGRLAAGVTAVSWSGHWHNGFLVFDYQDGSHYKYAGMLAGSNTWVIKEVIGGTHYTRAEAGETIQTGRRYALEVELSGDTATLRVDGQTKVSHTFASGIQGGQVRLRLENAHTHFQEVALKRLVNVTQYYYLGGQRVALRRDGGLTYLLADHLGSTALTVDRNGAKVAELRYKAYGETRFASGETPTDYRYTGQREEALLGGLVHMGARFYDVSLARWLSADTLVPEPGNPQALNRYSYVGGNSLK